jgi:glutaminyl-peptide cyclotransferase
MRNNLGKILLGLALLAMIGQGISTCGWPSTTKPPVEPPITPPPSPFPAALPMPDFSADSAYNFVKKQVDFGPRVPNTAAHKKCAAWMAREFRRMGLTVIEQKFQAKHYLGTTYDCVNVIAQYKPDAPKRVLLAAHWDSRFMADKDTRDTLKPIDGADDGASGVGVLLEIARQLQAMPPNIGVDLICFDAEDQGEDNGDGADTWCLGSQHWAKNVHRPNYQPYYAILLDMVGAKGARFQKEGISMQVAPAVVDKIWALAGSLGYGQYFASSLGNGITDDHVYVIRHARIPMIDIISTPNDGDHTFADYHHRHTDNMSVIDKNTLKAVGQTMSAVIWRSVAPVVQ